MIYLSFNEASLLNDSNYIETLKNYISWLKDINKLKIVREYYYTDKIFVVPLMNNKTLNDYLYDKRIDLELRRYLLSHLDKAKKVSTDDFNGLVEYIGSDDYSNYMNGFNISLSLGPEYIISNALSCDEWKKNNFSVNYFNFETEQNEEYEIKNFTVIKDYSNYVTLVNDEMILQISSGIDLYEKLDELYPNLVFCDNAKNQIKEMFDKSVIDAVITKLNVMQKYFSEKDFYVASELGASTESESVKNDAKLKNERLFVMPNGTKEFFFEHMKFGTIQGAKRIHFFPDCSNKKAYIGYVGKHLSTKKYKC